MSVVRKILIGLCVLVLLGAFFVFNNIRPSRYDIDHYRELMVRDGIIPPSELFVFADKVPQYKEGIVWSFHPKSEESLNDFLQKNPDIMDALGDWDANRSLLAAFVGDLLVHPTENGQVAANPPVRPFTLDVVVCRSSAGVECDLAVYIGVRGRRRVE